MKRLDQNNEKDVRIRKYSAKMLKIKKAGFIRRSVSFIG